MMGDTSGRTLMTTADFARVEAIFADAVGLDADSRPAAIDRACGDRSDLRTEVAALLAAHDALSRAEPPDTVPTPPGAGSRVGAYRLIEKIGEGGMGEVFRAERVDGAFDHQVAVKLTGAAVNREEIVRRFKVERQILASLRHPHIVTLLDGGATADGLGYFVMEYVEGVPISHYCRDRTLGLGDRLRLFQAVCAAVQYAHQRGIVHRDLKPANILIQADGTPKVLDFGLAKIVDAPPEAGSITQSLLPGPLTPNYASPEQLRGLPTTTACDVYALGVLLYEILTGSRPYETRGQTLDRIVEIVLHDAPRPPSAIVPAGPRPYPPSRLHGDLDAIVLKAMGKEPGERYDSAGELASDVGRVLRREPVIARPLSAAYALRRLAVRHKALVSVATLALVAVIVASGVAFWQRQVARREQARAEQLSRDVRQLATSLIFKVHDAVMPLAGSTEVRRTIVNDALAHLERLEAQSGGDPALRLELAGAYQQIAGILGDPQRPNLGDRDGALKYYERARSMAAAMTGPGVSYDVVNRLATANHQISTLYFAKGDRDKSLAAAREAVDRATEYQRAHPDDHRAAGLVAQSNFRLAWALPTADSIPVWERTLEYYEGELRKAPDSFGAARSVALVAKYLAAALDDIGAGERSERFHRRAVDLDAVRLRRNPDHRGTQADAAVSFTGLAQLLENRGELSEALPLARHALELRRQVAAADPKDVQARERLAYGLLSTARIEAKSGNLAVARALSREAIQVQSDVLAITGDTSARRQLASAWHELALTEERARQVREACGAFRKAVEFYSVNASTHDNRSLLRLGEAKERASALCR
jgi:non-specific serine/threonine protein kinase/serine/threonine-protein kinase